MADVQEWVDSIRSEVPEPLDSAVARQVRYAIQEFFRSSESWVHVERIEVQEDTVPLEALPDQTYVASTKFAYFEPSGRSERIKLTSTLPHRVHPDGQVSMFAHSGGTILLDGFEKGTLEIAVVVQPNRSVDSVPDLLADKWFDVIRRGAVARLLSVPDESWSNHGSSERYERHFREGIAKAKREARRDRDRPRRSVRFNKGFSW